MLYDFSSLLLIKRKPLCNNCADCIFMIVKTQQIFKEVKDRNMISDTQHPCLYSTTAADRLTVQRWKCMTVTLCYVASLQSSVFKYKCYMWKYNPFSFRNLMYFWVKQDIEWGEIKRNWFNRTNDIIIAEKAVFV